MFLHAFLTQISVRMGIPMQFNQQLLYAFTLAATLLCSTSFAQQDGKALLSECLKSQADEFQPLSKSRDAVYQKFSNRSLSIRSILRWLELDPKTADAKRVKEIAALEIRLKTLKDNASLTSTDATNNVAATIESTNVMLEDIKDERDTAVKPFAREFTALQRKYKAQETQLKPVMLELFREAGNAEATANLNRSYGSFSYSSGTASATYKGEGESKSAAICYIYLANEKIAKEELGMVNDKYPVAYRSNNQLEILVGNCRVTIYSAGKKLNGKQLDSSLLSFVDVEKLEAMMTP